MAQLKNLTVMGPSQLIGKVNADEIQTTIIDAPTTAGGASYGPGTNGQVLTSNGTSVYWGAGISNAGSAGYAASAAQATHAASAGYAASAAQATHAASANYVLNAASAGYALHTASAGYSASAAQATHAASAQYALSAGSIKNKVFYGTCNTVTATEAKVVTCPEFQTTDLVKGSTVFVTFDYTNSGAVGSITLNVNNTGAKPIKEFRNGAVSNIPGVNYLAGNQTYKFSYDGTNWVTLMDYDSNDVNRSTITYPRIQAGAGGILAKTLFMQTGAGTFSSIVVKSGTTINKNPIGFYLGKIYYANRNDDITALGNDGTSTSWMDQQTNLFDVKTSFAVANGDLAARSPLYLVGTLNNEGYFQLADTWWTQIPNPEDDGTVYIYVGQMYNDTAAYRCTLDLNNPAIWYKDGGWKEVISYSAKTGMAITAGYAITATQAIHANSANYGLYASSAAYALNSASATFAKSSGSAGYALKAASAYYAGSAGYALKAASAYYAGSAGYALKAASATYTLSSGSAGYALKAASAYYASSAGYALKAASAAYALSASSAGYAESANNANYSTSAGNATDDTKVLKTGDTMTGSLVLEHKANKSKELRITYSDTIDYWLGVGTANVNHGLYDDIAGKWVLSANATNAWYLNGKAACAGYAATAGRALHAASSTYTLRASSAGHATSAIWASSAGYAASAGSAGTATDNTKVLKAGDTMTGDLILAPVATGGTCPYIQLNDSDDQQWKIYTDTDSIILSPQQTTVGGNIASTQYVFCDDGTISGRAYNSATAASIQFYGFASCAGYAITAGQSVFAQSAAYALKSACAARAVTAGRALHAASSTYTLNAASATYSLSSGSAGYAASAETSESAGSAAYAAEASCAAHAESAGKTLAANLTSTTNALAYYTNKQGSFGSLQTKAGALYATANYAKAGFGTLPVKYGGTGATTPTNAVVNLVYPLPSYPDNYFVTDYDTVPMVYLDQVDMLTKYAYKIKMSQVWDFTERHLTTAAYVKSVAGMNGPAITLKNMTVGSKIYNGAADVEIKAADLDLAKSMTYLGQTTTQLYNGATATTINIKVGNATTAATAENGSVAIYAGTAFTDGNGTIISPGDEFIYSSNTGEWQSLGFASSFALHNHTHGNISNGGKISTTAAIATGSSLIIGTSSTDLARSSIEFSTASTNNKKKALTQYGTWETFNNYTLPDATTGAKGGVQIGDNLTINSGVLSLTGQNVVDALGYNPAEANGSGGIEYIVGTQSEQTSAWTGVTTESSLETGKVIAYKIPKASSAGVAVSLSLALAGGGTATNFVVLNNSTAVTTHFPINTVVLLTYDGSQWKTFDYNTNTTYSNMSVAERNGGTATAARLISSVNLRNATVANAGLAGTAAFAIDAGNAINADLAGTATFAIDAGNAVEAIHASSASYAATAGRALHAASSAYALKSACAARTVTAGHSVHAASSAYARWAASAVFALTAQRAPLNSTTNAVAYFSDATGTFAAKASADGALFATAENGALNWGTLPVAQGGTSATGGTAARANLSAAPAKQSVFYGVCATAQATLQKDVTLIKGEGYVQEVGTIIVVYFNNASANGTGTTPMTMKVENNEAKNLLIYNNYVMTSGTATSGWPAGAVVPFILTANGWTRFYWYNTTYYTDSVYCSTAADAALKVGTCSSYSLTKGFFQVLMMNTNTANSELKLNINNTGAKTIWINGVASSTSNYTLPAGMYLVYYDGSNFYFRTDGSFVLSAGSLPGIGVHDTASGRKGTLLINNNKELGVFDGSKWLVYSDTAGNAYMNGRASCAVYAATAGWAMKANSTELTGCCFDWSGSYTTGSWALIYNGETGTNGGAKFKGISPANFATLLDGQHQWVRVAGDGMTGTLRIVNNSQNDGTYDSLLYVEHKSNNDWGIKVNKTGYDYGIYAQTSASATNAIKTEGRITGGQVYGAVWNDYAEYRQSDELEPGRCVVENGDGTLSRSTERLQRGCEIVSDTFGFAIGETEECQTPTAASGRVLAYLLEDNEYAKSHIGWPVCSGPNGTVSIMTEEEEEKYPSRIIGTISEVPNYNTWYAGTNKYKEILVNGRIWIRIR